MSTALSLFAPGGVAAGARNLSAASMAIAIMAMTISSTAAVAQAPAPELSLEDAIRIASQRNPAHQRLLNDPDVDAARERAQFSRFFPVLGGSFNTSGGPTRTTTAQGVSSRKSSNASMSVSMDMLLLDGGERLSNLRITRATGRNTLVNIEQSAVELRGSITRLYQTAKMRELAVTLAENQLANQLERLEEFERRLGIATATLLDVMNVQQGVEDQEQALASARDEAVKARYALLGEMGIGGTGEVTLVSPVPATVDPESLDVDALVAIAIQRNPTIRLREFDVYRSTLSARVSKQTRWWPRLTARASYGRAESALDYGALFNPAPQNATLSLSLNASYDGRGFLDWYSSSANIISSEAQLSDAEHTLRGERLRVERLVRTAFIDLQNAHVSLATAERRADRRRELVEMAEIQMRNGSIPSLNFQQYVEALASAERGALDARLTVITRQIALEELLGAPLGR